MSASADRVHALREEINIHRIYYKCLTTDMINRIYIFIYSGAAGRNTGIRVAEHLDTAQSELLRITIV